MKSFTLTTEGEIVAGNGEKLTRFPPQLATDTEIKMLIDDANIGEMFEIGTNRKASSFLGRT